ncbi:MAG: peptidase MA family metallohydrolase [Chloroflexota bacterium]
MNTARQLLLFVVMVLSILFNARQARAQSGIELENVGAAHRFGEQITFLARIKASTPIQNISIIIVDESQAITHVEPLAMQADGSTEFRFDTRQNRLRPFSQIKWSYQFTLPDGSTVQSESFSMRYADDRFDWQSLESDGVRVNWYNSDTDFGQAAVNAAQSGLDSVGRLMAVDRVQPVDIFIYANLEDLQGTLNPNGENWVAGHANPALGVAMVVIEPGAEQNILMEQRIPHELMHVMMYRAVDAGYINIPLWLREGTATLAEIYPNVDYDRVLTDAVPGNALIPLTSLCASFPADTGRAFLAYAESRSFVNYLHENYGSSGLLNLAASYADGLDCERGTELVLGVSLLNLEATWRSSVLGQNALLPALQNIAPYLVLLCLVLIIPLINVLSYRSQKRKSK